MSWDPISRPQDYILLASEKSPGLAEIVGANSPRKWDERKGYGFSGAIVVFRGLGLSHFSVKLRLYTQIDWDNWHDWKRLVDKPPPPTPAKGDGGSSGFKRPRGMDIQHPLLADLGIHSVVVEDVLVPDQTDDGEWTIEIKFIEFRQPVFALSKPVAAQATPVDPDQAEIGRLNDQANSLAGPP
jgi:hypothetical protein